MRRPYEPYIPKTIIELRDLLADIIITSPKLLDGTGYFPGKNIETTFYALNESLRLMQTKLGEERYQKLRDMSDRTRAYFEADPDEKTGDTLKGCMIIHEMDDILKQAARNRRVWNQPSYESDG